MIGTVIAVVIAIATVIIIVIAIVMISSGVRCAELLTSKEQHLLLHSSGEAAGLKLKPIDPLLGTPLD